ncbi:hypothetical protein [Bacillus sp. FJAT-49736]|uniref:hypothetical protein n=1 Tax=Bacillus sp. FJAT-49736 TaxID=2833582 RepID=UPI001BC8D0BB|nr:hypothetical protein [Bacillus sp. FJAT-49736]MBS4175295.1 hypothetical protein [Bacillus sp. FJAT-49736]
MLTRFLNQHIPTSAGAIVMAAGILLLGAMQKVVSHYHYFAVLSTFLVLLLLTILYLALIRDLVRGVMWQHHLCNPIQSFGAGTWIAGTSVTILVMMSGDTSLKPIALALFSFNIIWMIGFLLLIIRNYIYLCNAKETAMRKKVHGILLLACVAVQSVLAAGHSLYGNSFVNTFGTWLWWLGCSLYVLGLIFVLNRYFRSDNRDLSLNWMNTNCIIHGAMSISGLVGETTGVVPPSVLFWVWIWVIAAFILVEGIEIVRSVQRIKKLGWKDGLWVYDTSQWARNFTFGMLLAFFMHYHVQGKLILINDFQNMILLAGPYIVIMLFILEVLVALTGRSAASKIPETLSM